MQDKYIKTFEKLEMGDKRKKEMRNILEQELASRKPAKKTGLSSGAKAGIGIAAAAALTIGVVFCIPTTRNAISATIRDMFAKEVPEGAIDIVEQKDTGREERVIPTDSVDEEVASEIMEAVESQDLEEDQYFESVIVTTDYYADPDLNQLANYYNQQGYTLIDLAKDAEYNDYSWMNIEIKEWFSDGFGVYYHIGDNATGYEGSTIVFKATEEQMQNYLENELAKTNYERVNHTQETVSFDEMWSQTTNEDGDIVYSGSWTGPEPEIKLMDSDRARFITYEVTYDPAAQIAICEMTEGGGVG